MKNIILILLVWAPISVWATCNRPVDNSKVVFFVDVNFSDMEIDAAQRAACARGEKLVVAPRNYRDHTRWLRDLLVLERRRNARCGPQWNLPGCNDALREFEAQKGPYNAWKANLPSLHQSIRSELQTLKNSGAKIQNFTISGHDGGGDFSGYKGGFSKHDMARMMGEFPEVNDVKSLLLLGCYTGVQSEITDWKAIFPDVNMIGGYDGAGPASDRPLGHSFLQDLLTRESNLTAQANQSRLQSYARTNIRGLNTLYSALYVQLECNEDEYYYGSGTRDGNRTFQRLDSQFRQRVCNSSRASLNQWSRQVSPFINGTSVPNSEDFALISRIYAQARPLEDCINALGVNLNLQQLLGMRFARNYEASFATFYRNDLSIAEELLRELDPSIRGNLWIPNAANLATKNRGEILQNIHQMHTLLAAGTLTPPQLRALTWLRTVSERHLQHYQSPLSWHEQMGGDEAPRTVERLTRN